MSNTDREIVWVAAVVVGVTLSVPAGTVAAGTFGTVAVVSNGTVVNGLSTSAGVVGEVVTDDAPTVVVVVGAVLVEVVAGVVASQCNIGPIDRSAVAVGGASGPGSLLVTM